jgi:hypothetical protein
LGNLKQLQTLLDIKHTRVRKLPKTIINLRKLLLALIILTWSHV